MFRTSIMKWLIAPILILSFSSLGLAKSENPKTAKHTIKKTKAKAPQAKPNKMGKRVGSNKHLPKSRKLAKAKSKRSQKFKKQRKKHPKTKAKKQRLRQKAKPAIKDAENL